jgi:hypothetical protein
METTMKKETVMKIDEMKENARARVETDNPGKTNFKVSKLYENLMDGTLITVSFQDSSGKEDFNHVHFGSNEIRTYRWHNDVLNAVSNYKERVWFFRFLEFAGMGGLIAFILVLVFSLLLCVLAFFNTNVNPSIVEVVKLSFTIILGFFFGSQASGKK